MTTTEDFLEDDEDCYEVVDCTQDGVTAFSDFDEVLDYMDEAITEVSDSADYEEDVKGN